MLANPTTPNLPDYIGFLYGPGEIDARFLPTYLGTATAGTTTSLIDSSQTDWKINQWQPGYLVTDVSQNEIASIVSNDTVTLTFLSPVPSAVRAGDVYVISPEAVSTSLGVALEIVNEAIQLASPLMYTLAVYNLAADRLINYAADIPNQTYFQQKRKTYRLMDPTMGIVSSSSNQVTAGSYLNPDQMKLFTLQDLESLKTPWGRRYIGIAQKYGTVIWGMS